MKITVFWNAGACCLHHQVIALMEAASASEM
jgi:hypothetical protein